VTRQRVTILAGGRPEAPRGWSSAHARLPPLEEEGCVGCLCLSNLVHHDIQPEQHSEFNMRMCWRQHLTRQRVRPYARQVVRVSVVGGFAAGLPAAPPGAPATIGLRNSWQRGTGYPHHADMCFGGFASQEGGRGARQGEVREGVEQEDRRLQEREHHG